MEFVLTILGSGGALPGIDTNPTAQCLRYGTHHYLIDASEGIQTRLTKNGIAHHKIERIFISHLHGDHYLGLMGLLFTMHLHRRKTELHLHAHRGLAEIITLHLKHAGSALCYPLIFHPLPEDLGTVIFENKHLLVEILPMQHRIPCVGFLFTEKQGPLKLIKDRLPKDISIEHIGMLKAGQDVLGADGTTKYAVEDLTHSPDPLRSYAFCSDTAFDPTLASKISNGSLLYHEATFADEDIEKAKETWHSTTSQAAQMAKLSGTKQLLIGHLSSRYKDPESLLREAQQIFPNTRLAEENKVYTVGD